MSEKFRNPIETGPEHIPTAEEIHAVFKEIVGKEYTVLINLEDEKGLYVLRIEVPSELENEKTEYEYMRKGLYKDRGTIETEIHVIYYKNDIPIHGTSAAKYRDGQWKVIK